MGEIIELPDNLMTLEDQRSLQSFGGSEISRGRATRYSWSENDNGDPVFTLYTGGANEKIYARITRNREEDRFEAETEEGLCLARGTLLHVLTVIDMKLVEIYGDEDWF